MRTALRVVCGKKFHYVEADVDVGLAFWLDSLNTKSLFRLESCVGFSVFEGAELSPDSSMPPEYPSATQAFQMANDCLCTYHTDCRLPTDKKSILSRPLSLCSWAHIFTAHPVIIQSTIWNC